MIAQDLDLTQPAHRRTIAVLIAQKLAGHTFPGEEKRIDRAVKIVLQGHVDLLEDGTARVACQSQTGSHYRVVNGHCGCPDQQAPAQRCKHRLALALERKARRLIATQWYAQDSRDGTWGIATSVTLPEAPSYACWLLSTPADPTPRYVPDTALVLGTHCGA